MKIETTDFESNYHGTMTLNDGTLLHNIDVWNIIKVDGIGLYALYQTGISYLSNDYNRPSTKLELSYDGGTSEVLFIINQLFESDFRDYVYINDELEKIRELCPELDTVDKLFDLYHVLMNNVPTITDFIDEDNLIFI